MWSAAAGLLNIGVLHAQHLIYEGYDSCPSPLYVVLNRDLLILSEVRSLFFIATDSERLIDQSLISNSTI